MDTADYQHVAWLARSFGRTDYLPLTPADLDALSSAGSYVEKYPGTHLFKEGENSVAAYVIQRGDVELYRTRKTGRRVVGRVRSGAVIGDIAMFQGHPYISSARAINRVRAFRLERAKLLPLLIEHPMIAMRWLVAGLSQLEATQQRVIRLMHRTVREQVAEVLLDEADDYNEVHLSQSSLADLLGASRQSVNESLAGFRSEGSIETGYRVIRILRPAALAEIAGRDLTSHRASA
ncbi:MAG: Crp/Fnr family transcriptional regulator [Acidimicrobiia bacterium]|nr:Crp/Fnr family transcriptional regulator [Acidimicrobiia bacterium]